MATAASLSKWMDLEMEVMDSKSKKRRQNAHPSKRSLVPTGSISIISPPAMVLIYTSLSRNHVCLAS